MLGHLECRGARGVGNRNDHIDIVIWPLALDAIGQLAPHLQTSAVDVGTVQQRIRARQVNVLEDAGGKQRTIGAGLGVVVAVHVDEDGLARRQVAHQFETTNIKCHRLGGDHHFLPLALVTSAEDHRTDALGITEGDQAHAVDHRYGSVAAAATTMHPTHGVEDVARQQMRPLLAQLMGEDVEQHLGV